MRVVLPLILICVFGFVVEAQGSEGSIISPSPAFLPGVHPEGEAPGPIHNGQSWRSTASSPSDPDGSVISPSPAILPMDPFSSEAPSLLHPNGTILQPPVALPPATSAPPPQKIKGIESTVSPSPSPSTKSISPPYKSAPAPSTAERNLPPSIQPIPPQMKTPTVSPPISTPTAPDPVATPPGNLPKTSPISQPIDHGSLPPNVDNRNESKSHNPEPVSPGSFLQPPVALQPPTSAPPPQKTKGSESSISPSPSQSTKPLTPPDKAVPAPSTAERSFPPPMRPIPPQRKAPAPVATPPGNLPKTSPISQPIEHGSLPPKVDKRNESRNHNLEPVSPAPVATPSTNEPKVSPISHSTNNGSFPPPQPMSPAPVFNIPKHLPVNQSTEPRSLPPTVHRRNSSISHTLEPVSQAPVAEPPANFPKNSSVSQPSQHGSVPPNVHNTTIHKGHIHTPEPVMPPPISTFPVDPPLIHPVIPAAPPNEVPAPVISPTLTPSRSFNGKNGGEPVSAPLNKKPKSPPAIVNSPAQAPSVNKARPFHHAPEPLTSPPKSPFNKEDHSPASSPSTTFHKHQHTRNTITSPAPASSYFVSPPTSKHQDKPIPPSFLPTNRRRHNAPAPMNRGSADSPFTFPIQSPVSQVSPAPSPSFKTFPHSTKIPFHPPKISPQRSFSKSPKKPILPRVQALPPPPPNEDCLSFVCSEPYTNSPPGVPCMCIWPMRVGLRLNVPLYTFFPLVSELASEISSGVFMKQSQVRIMGANAATDQPDKTDALIDLVPLGEQFDNTTAFLTSDRFWHKKVVIKSSYFGDYEVLYISYPGLPPSPPLPPSSVNMIDGGPYSNNGNNGRTIKPLGVDIQKRQHRSGLSKGIIAIIALSSFLAIVLCSAAVFALIKFRDHVSESQPTSTPRVFPPSLTKTPGTAGPSNAGASASTSFRSSIAAYAGSAKTFSMNEIEKATDNFHPSRILGEGGFGLVYSGNLEDGSKVAFKVLKREDHHGDREFLSEVEMLSRLHHRNLVKLIGICTELSFRCLVYELIPNGSVESHLHGVDREKSPLDWSARIKIALGAARGLAYLHEDSSPHVIHRDFKSSNILLENDFTPKVSDFGLARTAADEDNRHISTRVMGTFGYVAPEYAMTGHLLVKSDVYSYGVVLLELLTGRKPVDFSQPPGQENLVAWARPLLTSREGLEVIIDPSLGSNVPFDSVAKVAAIASMCVQPEVSDRPFMGEVVQALKLVCNECDEAKEAGSTSSNKDGSSSDFYTVTEQLPDNFQSHSAAANYDFGVDIENGLSTSEIFSSSARFERQVSGSFRRHSYSGPLRTGRSKRLWHIIRKLSGGSVSEHGDSLR
ncbi:receptor-like serine/threonine-protein kinase ALE2 isoform X4 [Medicago truncatula]|uniref:receptor-like serine/threonine-protein kinase ALE2 isoform X4 n=1 Tax=Medicago truncatula TaxID=3880 RepID=UPI000D2F3E84|nr:receptor-like serine/threonine-protein kinase ALE2 isoform X4 [Medicago truncatula]